MRDTYPLNLVLSIIKQYKQGLKSFVIEIVDSEAAKMHIKYYGYRNTMIFAVHCANTEMVWWHKKQFLVAKETVVYSVSGSVKHKNLILSNEFHNSLTA